MIIDSLTIAATAVFLIALGAFVRFCMVGICGLTSNGEHNKGENDTHDVRS